MVPAIVRAENHCQTVQDETFAPILYVIPIQDFEDAIAKHNDVPAGTLVGDLHRRDVRRPNASSPRSARTAASPTSTSAPAGAEIGGAFGGEKETGGGRESGSDSWKAYMRRQTNTVNWSDDLPLAQGISFG